MNKWLLTASLLLSGISLAQNDTLTISNEIKAAKKHSKFYEYSGYIPYDLLDCIRVISTKYSDADLKKLKAKNNEEIYLYGIDSTETGLRMSWGLEGNSHLAQYFNSLGLYHHKTMKLCILICYHDYLNGRSVELKKNIRVSKSKYRKAERTSRKRTKAIIKAQKKNKSSILKYEDKEKDNSYRKHDRFYQNRDKKLKELEEQRQKELKKNG